MVITLGPFGTIAGYYLALLRKDRDQGYAFGRTDSLSRGLCWQGFTLLMRESQSGSLALERIGWPGKESSGKLAKKQNAPLITRTRSGRTVRAASRAAFWREHCRFLVIWHAKHSSDGLNFRVDLQGQWSNHLST
jgi:hypothetical protein